jgi:hypothetical protein
VYAVLEEEASGMYGMSGEEADSSRGNLKTVLLGALVLGIGFLASR